MAERYIIIIVKKIKNYIKEYLEGNGSSEKVIITFTRSQIYDFLVYRDSEEYFKPLEPYVNALKADYKKSLEKLEIRIQGKRQKEGPWFHIAPNYKVKTLKKIIGIFHISHKEYFTLDFTKVPNTEFYNYIKIFVSIIPNIVLRLYELGNSNNDNIQLKIPLDLMWVFRHRDTLVIHYRNATSSKIIREIVNQECEKVKIKLARNQIRVESSFDFSDKIQEDSFSHSLIISEIIAKEIVRNAKKFKNLNNEAFASYIEKKILELNKKSIEDMHKVFIQ